MKKVLFLLFFMPSVHAAIFTVTNTANSGAGSLLQAILDANAAGGNSTIDFNIPGIAPQIIAPTAFYSTSPNRAYPPLINPNITIDATTQSGFALGSPSVIIDCNALSGNQSCLSIVGTDSCVIKGIGIERCVNGGSGRAVSIEATATLSAYGNQILQCRLGSFGGFGNTRGIVMSGGFAGQAVLNTLIEQNVLSGNSIAGCQGQFNVSDTVVQNNYLGCNYGGTIALGNAYGVVFLANGGFVSTGNMVQNNVISGN